MTAAQVAADLRHAIDEGLQLFDTLDAGRTAQRPAAGGWCAREVLGHLIDSACNNHRRFVVGQWSADLVFAGYEQDEWVRVQGYRDAPWPDLVGLWSAYNRHLAHVIASAPDDVISRPRSPHNFDQILGAEFPPDQPQPLAALMADYVVHLRHHLDQIRRMAAA
jgi:hypothetical protein